MIGRGRVGLVQVLRTSTSAARDKVTALSTVIYHSLAEVAYGLPTQRSRQLRDRDSERSSKLGHWFTPGEAVLIEILTSLLVPSEADKPGMAEVEVLGPKPSTTLGRWIAESESKQIIYSRGLMGIERLVHLWYGQKLQELPPAVQQEFLERVFRRDREARRKLGILGTLAKHAKRLKWVTEGTFEAAELLPVLVEDAHAIFYTSRVSWVWLGFDGPPMPLGYPDPTKPRAMSKSQVSPGLEETVDLLGGPDRSGPKLALPKDSPVDVVVIGSGAGGAVVAKELGEAGAKVVVLEAGRKFDPHRDYPTHREDFEIAAADPFGSENEGRDVFTTAHGRTFDYVRAKGVGGSTLRYVAVSPRLHEADFRVWSEDGVAADWPMTYEDLEPYYSRVEYELGVSGADGDDGNPFGPPRGIPYPTPPHPFNLASRAVKVGADRLGWHMVKEPLAIPSREWGGRPPCIGAGTCEKGCAIKAKSSMDVTFIPKALSSGNVEIRTECMAREIVVGRDGRARGVVYFDKEGGEHRIDARIVVVAGNAVETARLLLMSSSSLFPDGLANSSGLVGKNFMEHLSIFASGRFAQRTDPWRGNPTGGMIQDLYATDSARGFARGWTTLVSGYRKWPLSVARSFPGWGDDHKARVEERFGHTASVASVGEQLPDLRNQVVLDPHLKDCFGLPAPLLINDPRQNDRRMIKAISDSLRTLLEASGASEVKVNRHTPGKSAHYMGTCRMGSDPRQSVVGPLGRAHDVPNLFIADGSVFVTGGAVNPALTISALAMRASEEIIRVAGQLEV